MTRSDSWKRRPCVLRYREFKDLCAAYKVTIPEAGAVALTFRIAMPPSWSKLKKDAYDGQPHQGTPDLDNLVKAVLDAVLTEDRQVWKIQAEKRWAREPSIEVEPL